ncbi:MAG: Protein erfK/srfK precursor [uncultured Solirubrobacteraceae bacterium]|uniref:Protein erfK/srfK n=1 Tax=uncultured Solirubrobacteraceae bacterium TaxID=1162706 RepID=A0A6J4SC76_9ACTN|nr:MAG: Protein erfK/srfK precursor [uncultured Solirubrobacteraceae bacterium]
MAITCAVSSAAALAALSAGAGAPVPTPPQTADRLVGALPARVEPAFTPGEPRRLGSVRHVSHWAPVIRAVSARTAPDAGAPVAATLSESTPEGTRNLVAVIDRRTDRNGVGWVRARLPVLPNDLTGWVPRRSLGGYQAVRTRLDIDLRRLRATLYRSGRPILRADVGVGMAGWATPKGRFYIRNKLTRYRSATYGPVAFGTSARSPSATDWPAGGFVGIHGTDRPQLLPGRVSHGCIRMRNADILELARSMPIGTPVRIH